MRGHAFGESVFGQLCVRQVIGLDTLAKGFAVAGHATHRYAAKVHTVVAFFAADKAGFAAHALGSPISAGHFQRGVCGLRARACEEHIVEAIRGEGFQAVGQFKGLGMAVLKRGGVIQRSHLVCCGFHQLGTRVTQSATPQARQAVQDLAPVHIGVIHPLGTGDQARLGFEVSVACKGHPVRFQESLVIGR